MAKSFIISFFFFLSLLILPPIDYAGVVGEAYAAMGGNTPDIQIKKKFAGKVEEIDHNLKTVTVVRKTSNGEFRMVFTFDADTTVNLGTEKKNISDLKIGDKVTVRYTTTAYQKIAHSLLIER
jgi:hypothetical protein